MQASDLNILSNEQQNPREQTSRLADLRVAVDPAAQARAFSLEKAKSVAGFMHQFEELATVVTKNALFPVGLLNPYKRG